ncbi:Mannose-1-phosphate guanylyltransferase 1 [compost metagenome]
MTAEVLLAELKLHAPEIEGAVRTAVAMAGRGSIIVLGEAFRTAPKVSIDYALMEKTALASVLEVDFGWSDLGAWDAIAASGEGGIGEHIFEDVEGCLARAADGMLIAAVGVRNLAIIAEPDAVLVCDLSRSQDVKKVVEGIRLSSPQHADFARRPDEGVAAGARRFREWLRFKALPVWSTLGQDEGGAFAECLALDGRRVPAARRARVQARQIYVYAQAGLMGWEGPWARAVRTGMASLDADFLRDDGMMRTLLCASGRPLDETVMVYDQAFLLLALATALKAGIGEGAFQARGAAMRDALLKDVADKEGLREAGEQPFQSNVHMHMFEAALAWEEVSDDPAWRDLADRICDLALTTFVDSETGRLREFFDECWQPASGDGGRLVEPGHQFEWAWLLARYGEARGDHAASAAARRLYVGGREGISERHAVAVNALNDDGSVRTTRARLWPQAEWLKCALIMAQETTGGEQAAYLDDASAALRALWLYLTPDGLWRDMRLEDGSFIEEPAPASSLYHIVSGFTQLAKSSSLIGEDWAVPDVLR